MSNLRESMEAYAKRVRVLLEHVRGNAQATKQSLVGPFFTILGYDVTDPRECLPEYRDDLGGGRAAEPIGWGFKQGGHFSFFVEAKEVGGCLPDYDERLAHYFARDPHVKLGILTNGVQWRFFTDVARTNVMDEKPFVKWDVLEDATPPLDILTVLQKPHYNPAFIRAFAQRHRTQSLIRRSLDRVADPSSEIMRRAVARIEAGIRQQKTFDSWKPNPPPTSMIPESEIAPESSRRPPDSSRKLSDSSRRLLESARKASDSSRRLLAAAPAASDSSRDVKGSSGGLPDSSRNPLDSSRSVRDSVRALAEARPAPESARPIEAARQSTPNAVLASLPPSSTDLAREANSKEGTTAEELAAFETVKNLVGPGLDIGYEDSVPYFKIHLETRRSWVFVRLFMNRRHPVVCVPLTMEQVAQLVPGRSLTMSGGWTHLVLGSPEELLDLGPLLRAAYTWVKNTKATIDN
jgi:hypothetical protein